MNAGELFRETIKKGGRPERQLRQYEAIGFASGDPIDVFLREGQHPGCECYDKWGTLIIYPEDAPGRTPHITEENKVIKDITRWREYVKVPDIEAASKGDWSTAISNAEKVRKEGKLATVLMATGIFEQIHFLMGFEDTLTALYEHPDEMHELIECITDFRIRYLRHICEKLRPDAILSHDDWGTKTGLFMKPEIWREFFKEPYRRFYEVIRSHDIIAIHHADSYLVPIIEDMVEIGIDVWQGVLPENNIPHLLGQLEGRMTLMGGIGAVIDRPDVTEKEARDYVKSVLEKCACYTNFIPCITYGAPGTVYSRVDSYINDEIDKYNSRLHIRFELGKPDGKMVAVSEETHDKVESNESAGILDRIRMAVEEGQSSRVARLLGSEEAEAFGTDEIIQKALIEAMNRVGDDFSSGEIFVPEMLLAAKAMKTALGILRPKMVSENSRPLGRACIGTVKGDLHDIGKNLVKVMFEGSGIEVIDLGTDVLPEAFVRAAIDEKCDIICCSSLLTTTVWEMKNVVDACRDAGIRDDVTIMIGGAPVTQKFCDEIGADIYTADAGEAARQAVNVLRNK